MKPITKADLVDQRGPGGPALLCRVCDAVFSANAGDYFQLEDSHEFHHCEAPMRLARKVVRFVDVKLPQRTR